MPSLRDVYESHARTMGSEFQIDREINEMTDNEALKASKKQLINNAQYKQSKEYKLFQQEIGRLET